MRIYGGGIDDAKWLEDRSKIIGEYGYVERSVSDSCTGGSTSTSHRRELILSAADLAALPKGRAIVFASGARPTLIRTQRWMDGPHAEAIRASVRAHNTRSDDVLAAEAAEHAEIDGHRMTTDTAPAAADVAATVDVELRAAAHCVDLPHLRRARTRFERAHRAHDKAVLSAAEKRAVVEDRAGAIDVAEARADDLAKDPSSTSAQQVAAREAVARARRAHGRALAKVEQAERDASRAGDELAAAGDALDVATETTAAALDHMGTGTADAAEGDDPPGDPEPLFTTLPQFVEQIRGGPLRRGPPHQRTTALVRAVVDAPARRVPPRSALARVRAPAPGPHHRHERVPARPRRPPHGVDHQPGRSPRPLQAPRTRGRRRGPGAHRARGRPLHTQERLTEREPMTLTVYSRPGCVQCTATTRALDKGGVSYTVVDLTTDDTARDYVLALGHLQAPVVVTETGHHWSGYRPDQITTHLQRTASR